MTSILCKVLCLFSIFALLTALSACDSNGSSRPEDDNVQISSDRVENAGFFIIGAEIKSHAYLGPYINRTSDARANHVFVPPGHRRKFADIKRNTANIKEIAQADLKSALLQAFNQVNPRRLILVQDMHGAPGNGNQCYVSQSSCTINAAYWHDIINALDRENRLKPSAKKLEHLLLLPLSCFNKLLFDALASTLGAPTGLSFDISSVPLKEVEVFDETSPVNHLLEGKVDLFNRPSENVFVKWVKDKPRLSYLLQNMKTLEDADELHVLLEHVPEGAENEVKHYPKGDDKVTAGLMDFGLMPELLVSHEAKLYTSGLSLGGIIDATVPQSLKNNVREAFLISPLIGTWGLDYDIDSDTGKMKVSLSDLTVKPDLAGVQYVVLRIKL